MAAPTTTSRSTPVGTALTNGLSTKIAFAADPDVSFWEKTVTPPGLDGGDAIDCTTMFNTSVVTMLPRTLKTATDLSVTVAYDPVVLDQILALINVNTDVTVHFPNGDTWDFYGFLRVFQPQEHVRGSQPEAQITITPSNADPDAANAETVPNYKTSVGTD